MLKFLTCLVICGVASVESQSSTIPALVALPPVPTGAAPPGQPASYPIGQIRNRRAAHDSKSSSSSSHSTSEEDSPNKPATSMKPALHSIKLNSTGDAKPNANETSTNGPKITPMSGATIVPATHDMKLNGTSKAKADENVEGSGHEAANKTKAEEMKKMDKNDGH